jgi:hypothetical protein
LLVAAVIAGACACAAATGEGEQAPLASWAFIAAGAKDVTQAERQGIRHLTYSIAEPYPAAKVLCELTNHLHAQNWKALLDDPLNPGSPSGALRGWGDFGDATRGPELHVHQWMSSWLNDSGDLVTYVLRYEYPETTTPDLKVLRVTAMWWPAAIVRQTIGDRARELRATAIASENRSCTTPDWSEFVTETTRGVPVIALPIERLAVRSILISNDIDGIAGRIAAGVMKARPDLRVTTVHDREFDSPDATLAFDVECYGNVPGAGNGFFVREAIVYTRRFGHGWTEPPRVLFHWMYGGKPADSAFVDQLIAALTSARG